MISRSASEVEHLDRYATSSSAGVSGIFLAASSSGAATAPFFSGRLLVPRRGADLALVLAQVVRTRYYTPPGMVQRLIQQSDPVITCGGGLLRFEGFSACCGVYARLDLLANALEASRMDPGTANVDFNPPMRAALAQLQDGSATRLAVSKEGFELTSESSSAFERRVSLPARWLKGFVEVQAHQSRMRPCFSVRGALAQRFLKDLPRVRTRGAMYVSLVGNMPRLSAAGSARSTVVGGVDRLRMLASLAHYAEELTVYSSGDGATAWQLDTPDSRMFLVLSPEPARGFSGEGQVLEVLAGSTRVTNRVGALLRWQSTLDEERLAKDLEVPREEIRAALAKLGTKGLVGFDLSEGKYFHRELPFDLSSVNKLHPRFWDARALAEAGQVEIDVKGTTAWVRGKDGDYLVRRDADGEWHCICPWVAKHGTSRGPCKHILATRMSWGEEVDRS